MKITARIELPKKLTAKFKELKMPLSGGYEEGYDDGYAEGHSAGYKEGRDEGSAEVDALNQQWLGFWSNTLEHLDIPEGTTKLNDYCLYQMTGIKSVSFPETLTRVGSYAFQSTKLEELIFPASLDWVGNRIARYTSTIKTITFLGQPTTINSLAFDDIYNSITVNVPWAEGAVSGAPWGAPSGSTINYNYKGD